MKKMIPFFLILMLLFSGCGNEKSVTYHVTDTIVEMISVDSTMHYSNTYDDQWRTLSTTVSQNGEVWSTIEYSYSEDNTVVSITSTAYDQTSAGENRREFDKDGNIIKLETWEDGQQTSVSYRVYDQEGRITEDVTTYFEGYIRKHKQSFSYDSQGNRILASYEQTAEDGTLIKNRTDINYDSNGRRAREVKYQDDTMTDYTEFTWEGNVETGLRYTPDGNLNSKQVCTYDDHGNLLCQEMYSGDSTLGTRTSYRYVGSDGSVSSGIPE